MTREGPPLDLLTRRLAECPRALFDEVRPAAAVNDVLVGLGGAPLDAAELARVRPLAKGGAAAARALVLAGAWLMGAPSLRAFGPDRGAAFEWLAAELPRLAGVVAAEPAIADPDRREEIARSLLAALGLRPFGETPAAAEQRRQALDSVRRAAVIAEMRAKQERARELARKMAEQAAREAAARPASEW